MPELFRPWAFRIASRAGFRHLKRETRQFTRFEDEVSFENVAAPEAPASELLQYLDDVENLSPASRAVLALHFREELSLPDVAAVLGLPLGTVKSRLAYGLAALRRQLGRRRAF